MKREQILIKSRHIDNNNMTIMSKWVVSLIRFGAGIVKCTKSQLNEIDRKTNKVMTMNKELHPRSYVDDVRCKMYMKAEQNSLL